MTKATRRPPRISIWGALGAAAFLMACSTDSELGHSQALSGEEPEVSEAAQAVHIPAAQSQLPPSKKALVHFCKSWEAGPSEAVRAFPTEQWQAAWLAEMTAAASRAGIDEWPSFQAGLARHAPAERQAWIELGIATHGLQAECASAAKR